MYTYHLAKEKKKHPATVVVVGWVLFVLVLPLAVWLPFCSCFCCCCFAFVVGVLFSCVFGLFWACLGLGSANCSARLLSCVLRAFFGVVWCGVKLATKNGLPLVACRSFVIIGKVNQI